MLLNIPVSQIELTLLIKISTVVLASWRPQRTLTITLSFSQGITKRIAQLFISFIHVYAIYIYLCMDGSVLHAKVLVGARFACGQMTTN